ncbi:leishmanolysin [Pseudemcibacter aquimaris]|uniref:leishmanolysin n=1 Tax=Pseudemcibacter aquimaris TaxID=2857064 RepID=UPI002013680D|nr:leishmanolysin [Pseudemcibacter aquimaris]MCC3861385.1 hypothetical protein [Pseudemcibacter aquimaris]WDU58155.1 hypothetical protein KW060_13255 [Pseudemcibacter aquimaris]
MPRIFKSIAQENANYNFATMDFFDLSYADFIAISLEYSGNARGGNGNGRGGGNGGNDGNDGSSSEPLYTYISNITGSDYNIEIQFTGDGWGDIVTSPFVEAFEAAADFLSSFIVGDRPDYISADDPNNFFNQDIDDMLIEASLISIDGSGGVLGRAGPTHIIKETGQDDSEALPFAGIMEFDVADAGDYLAIDLWDDIVLHEMFHSIGLGTMWEHTGVVDVYIDDMGTKRPVDDVMTYDYLGQYATQYNDGSEPIIETDGGSGTAGGHWDEETYDNELMTGYINDVNYLSQMSLASLADLGYDVKWDATVFTELV